MRILVIEDEKKTAAFLAKGLREAEFDVDLAQDGETGLEMARATKFDLAAISSRTIVTLNISKPFLLAAKSRGMKTTPLAQLIFISCICSLTFTFFGASARAQGPTPTPATHWLDGDADWFEAGKWDMGLPSCSPPVAAYVNNGGRPSIATSATCANSLVLGNSAGESGSTVVSGSNTTLTVGDPGVQEVNPDIINPDVPGTVIVGYYGKGDLIIKGGAHVNNIGSYIGAAANSFGSVTVIGEGSRWFISHYFPGIGYIGARLFIGGDGVNPGGTALLNVTDGGSVVVLNDHTFTRAITVHASGTITGNGTVTTTPLGLGTGLTYIQGTLIPSAGTLTFTHNLELTLQANTICNVTPESADNIEVGGNAILDGRLSVIMTGDFRAAPSRYTLVHVGGTLNPGFFSISFKYPTDEGWHPEITHDDNNIYLDRIYDANVDP